MGWRRCPWLAWERHRARASASDRGVTMPSDHPSSCPVGGPCRFWPRGPVSRPDTDEDTEAQSVTEPAPELGHLAALPAARGLCPRPALLPRDLPCPPPPLSGPPTLARHLISLVTEIPAQGLRFSWGTSRGTRKGSDGGLASRRGPPEEELMVAMGSLQLPFTERQQRLTSSVQEQV